MESPDSQGVEKGPVKIGLWGEVRSLPLRGHLGGEGDSQLRPQKGTIPQPEPLGRAQGQPDVWAPHRTARNTGTRAGGMLTCAGKHSVWLTFLYLGAGAAATASPDHGCGRCGTGSLGGWAVPSRSTGSRTLAKQQLPSLGSSGGRK